MASLANTKWKWNNNLVGLPDSFSFSINFFSYTDQIRLTYNPNVGLTYYDYKEEEALVVYSISNGVGTWVDEYYKTIEIISGDDVENETLQNILSQFAVQEQDAPTTETLKGRNIRFNNELTLIKFSSKKQLLNDDSFNCFYEHKGITYNFKYFGVFTGVEVVGSTYTCYDLCFVSNFPIGNNAPFLCYVTSSSYLYRAYGFPLGWSFSIVNYDLSSTTPSINIVSIESLTEGPLIIDFDSPLNNENQELITLVSENAEVSFPNEEKYTIKAGTYKFNDVLSISSADDDYYYEPVDFTYLINGEIVQCIAFDVEADMNAFAYQLETPIETGDYIVVYNASTKQWLNYDYKTITIPNDTEVSVKFYEWFVENTEVSSPSEQKYKTIGELLTGIADSIRNKKGTTDKINAQNIPDEILGISGGGTDTADATATASDMLLGKTAYVNGKKITGTIETWDGSVENGVEGGAVVFVGGVGGGTPTPIPVNEYVESVYFNTSLSVEEVVNMVKSTLLKEWGDDYCVYANVFTWENDAGGNTSIMVEHMFEDTDNNLAELIDIFYFTDSSATPVFLSRQMTQEEWGNDSFPKFVGWNPELINPLPIGKVNDASWFPNDSINSSNFSSIMSITPYESRTISLSGDYDGRSIVVSESEINIEDLLKMKKLPLKIKFESGGGDMNNTVFVVSVWNETTGVEELYFYDEPNLEETNIIESKIGRKVIAQDLMELLPHTRIVWFSPGGASELISYDFYHNEFTLFFKAYSNNEVRDMIYHVAWYSE